MSDWDWPQWVTAVYFLISFLCNIAKSMQQAEDHGETRGVIYFFLGILGYGMGTLILHEGGFW